MIQQINTIQAQPGAQAQPTQSAQPQKNSESFQSVMQKTTDQQNQGKDTAVSEKKEPDKGKASEQDANPANGQAASADVNVSSLAAMLQQLQPAANSVSLLAAGKQQAVSVQEVAGISPQAAATAAGTSATVQTLQPFGSASVLPTASAPIQQNPAQAIASAAASAGQQTASAPVEPQTSAATPAPAETAVLPFAPQQASDSVKPQVQLTAGLQNTQVQAKPQQEQTSAPKQLISPVQTEPAIPAVQLNPAGSSETQPGTQKQGAVLSASKKNLSADESTYSNQATIPFSDFMQTGNVIIKISDAASNTAKAACQQIADKISVNYKAGNPQFQMDLFPKNLGKVTVKLAMENGTLTVEIAAANPKTQSMLLSDSGQIRSMIETTVNHPVQIMQPSQEKQWYQQDQGQSHTQQQQEKQKQESDYRVNDDDSNLGKDDFLTVMQQLKVKAYTV